MNQRAERWTAGSTGTGQVSVETNDSGLWRLCLYLDAISDAVPVIVATMPDEETAGRLATKLTSVIEEIQDVSKKAVADLVVRHMG